MNTGFCIVTGFLEGDEMDFEHFLVGLSHFNSPGRKDEKMKTAFRLHDNDDDGVISFDDMKAYVKAITHETLEGKRFSSLSLTSHLCPFMYTYFSQRVK